MDEEREFDPSERRALRELLSEFHEIRLQLADIKKEQEAQGRVTTRISNGVWTLVGLIILGMFLSWLQNNGNGSTSTILQQQNAIPHIQPQVKSVMTTEELAAHLGVNADTVRRRDEEGKLVGWTKSNVNQWRKTIE